MTKIRRKLKKHSKVKSVNNAQRDVTKKGLCDRINTPSKLKRNKNIVSV